MRGACRESASACNDNTTLSAREHQPAGRESRLAASGRVGPSDPYPTPRPAQTDADWTHLYVNVAAAPTLAPVSSAAEVEMAAVGAAVEPSAVHVPE